MATNAENLSTLYANTLAELASISADRRPSYTVGDRTVNWTEYRAMLMKSLVDIRKEMQLSGGPLIVRGYARA